MGVTRQTVSRWENGDVLSDLKTTVSIASFFSCSVDTLLEGELSKAKERYSNVRIVHIDDFKVACYTLISRNPERDVSNYMMEWEHKVSLKDKVPDTKLIGWPFKAVSEEQLYTFGMHGFTAGYTLPAVFSGKFDENNVEIKNVRGGEYASILVQSMDHEPHRLITGAFRIISEAFRVDETAFSQDDDTLVRFTHSFERDGDRYIEVFIKL